MHHPLCCFGGREVPNTDLGNIHVCIVSAFTCLVSRLVVSCPRFLANFCVEQKSVRQPAWVKLI